MKQFILGNTKASGLRLPWYLLAPLCAIFCVSVGCASPQQGKTPESDSMSLRIAQAPAMAPQSFIAVAPDARASIIVQHDAAAGTGYGWKVKSALNFYKLYHDPDRALVDAVVYLQEAVTRMTGQELQVTSGNDLSRGIVLTTLAGAPPELRQDPEVLRALKNTGEDAYNAREAFYVSSSANRVVIIGNTVEGILQGVVELLESVDYEVLGMGPNWMHIPDYTKRPLTFSLQRSGRAGFYLRNLSATTNQQLGNGTLFGKTPLSDPADETVDKSYGRWLTGTRMPGRSMPRFPGHVMQSYHDEVIKTMRERQTTDGFLTVKTVFAPAAERPAAAPDNDGWLWINTDAPGQPEAGKLNRSDGDKWVPQGKTLGFNLDFSVPFVRQIIFDAMRARATQSFEGRPDDIFVFGTDPEDGTGYADLKRRIKNKNWYPEYLQAKGVEFGQPYVLHGFKGLTQARESWDAGAPSDTVFGFNNWLLREFDQWIDSLPAEQRTTTTGRPKKELVRASLFSYNYHDVPPHFNLDPRVRVIIAGFPKHRGQGQWKNIVSQLDTAEAFRVLLPREPSGVYWIRSLAVYRDATTCGISGSESAASAHRKISELYQSGIKAFTAEMDFNFGKLGLTYYLYAKLLWNPTLSVEQLEALRVRWLQRSFGSGWREMKEYYDFMTPENYGLNAPRTWSKAIRFIEAADRKIDEDKEPQEQRRLDDVKQFWYFYYLLDSDQAGPASPALREFVWKGQMSYMTAMFMVMQKYFKKSGTAAARSIAGPQISDGPAHYSHAETQKWWSKVLDFWQLTPVQEFAETRLSNGQSAAKIDLNDVVLVREFQVPPQPKSQAPDVPLFYNSGGPNSPSFLTYADRAGQEIGFKLFWPFQPTNPPNQAKDVSYGISRWDAVNKEWEELVDEITTFQTSRLIPLQKGDHQIVEARYPVPQPGVYRITVGRGGNVALLTTLDYDPQTREYSGVRGHTYFTTYGALSQPTAAYFYIPKGTKTLDMEIWSTGDGKLQLHSGLPATGLKPTRIIDVTAKGTHSIALEAGEDGSVAALKTARFGFPYLYSVPLLWAKSPAALMVPRAVAKADGLTATE